jgi:hypothetical protein
VTADRCELGRLHYFMYTIPQLIESVNDSHYRLENFEELGEFRRSRNSIITTREQEYS